MNKIYKCQYCGKEFDSKQKFGGHIVWCKENPDRSGKSNFHNKKYENDIRPHDILRDDLFCQYCGKQCKNINSLRQHEIRCKENPNKIKNTLEEFNNKIKNQEIDKWNKGLTKDTNESLKKSSETYKRHLKEGKFDVVRCTHSDEFRKKQSIRAFERKLGGKTQSTKFKYKNILLESSYEYKVAITLDENNILWERPGYFYWTDDNNKLHRYYPDFYLPEYNVYLDPKNDFLINNINSRLGLNDKDKISKVSEQNNIIVIILRYNELTWDKIFEKINNL